MATTYISRLKLHFLLWFGIVTPLFIAGPLAMFAANFGDFDIGARQLAELLLPILPFVIVAACATAALPFQTPIKVALVWIAIAMYVQGNLVVWDYGRFDGTDIPWSEFSSRGWIDTAIWLGILALLVVGRRIVLKDAALIVSGLCVIQLGSAALAFSGSKAPYEMRTPEASGETLYSFSKEKGMLMIILDEFSSQAFYSILQTRPETKKEFADFTYYRDTMSAFPTTYAAIPAILTGQPAPIDGSLSAYFERSAPDSINEQLARTGWNSDVVTFHPICKQFKSGTCQSLNQATSRNKHVAAKKELYKLLDLTLFRHAPHYLKIKIYNNEKWFLQNEGLSSLIPNHQASIRFVESFQGQINGNAQQPTFKAIHLLVPHGPYHLTPECSRYVGPSMTAQRMFGSNVECAFNLVGKIFERMKESDVYDSTTIVLVADHGTPIDFDRVSKGPPVHKNLRRAFPLLLIKPAGYRAGATDEIKTDDRQLSQLEILGLLNDVGSLGLHVPPTHARTDAGDRLFHNYAWVNDNWSSDTLPKVKSFAVKGESWNYDNWRALTPDK
jgi:hypothetical protein